MSSHLLGVLEPSVVLQVNRYAGKDASHFGRRTARVPGRAGDAFQYGLRLLGAAHFRDLSARLCGKWGDCRGSSVPSDNAMDAG
jgi:hypothetical protein